MSLPTTKEKEEAARILVTIYRNLEIASPGPYPRFIQSAVFIYLGEKEFFVLSQVCLQIYNFPVDLTFRTIYGVPFAVLNESSFFRISYSENAWEEYRVLDSSTVFGNIHAVFDFGFYL